LTNAPSHSNPFNGPRPTPAEPVHHAFREAPSFLPCELLSLEEWPWPHCLHPGVDSQGCWLLWTLPPSFTVAIAVEQAFVSANSKRSSSYILERGGLPLRLFRLFGCFHTQTHIRRLSSTCKLSFVSPSYRLLSTTFVSPAFASRPFCTLYTHTKHTHSLTFAPIIHDCSLHSFFRVLPDVLRSFLLPFIYLYSLHLVSRPSLKALLRCLLLYRKFVFSNVTSNMADNLCGPSTALKSFSEHVNRDRSVHQDRAAPGRAGPSVSSPAFVVLGFAWRGRKAS
jgi:hypothetical protein